MLYDRFSRARLGAGLTALLLAATAMPPALPAAPLDEQTCEQLKREVGELEGIGARVNMAKGAAWGKSNLSSAQLEQVKKLIELDEAVAFRCPKPRPVPEVQPAAAVPAKVKGRQPPKGAPKVRQAQPGQPGAPAAKAPPGQPQAGPATPNAAQGSAAKQARVKPKAVARPAAGGPAPDSQPAATAPLPKLRPRPPAPKPQDAYLPPPASAK